MTSTPTGSTSSSRRQSESPRPLTPSLSATIRVSPSEIVFHAVKSNPQIFTGHITLRNLTLDSPLGFKFKTNAPDRYSIRPVLGVLLPGGNPLEVLARCNQSVEPTDRVMIESVTLTMEEAKDLNSKTWRYLDKQRIVDNFIHCRLAMTTTANGLSVGTTHSLNAPRRAHSTTHSRNPSSEVGLNDPYSSSSSLTPPTRHISGSSRGGSNGGRCQVERHSLLTVDRKPRDRSKSPTPSRVAVRSTMATDRARTSTDKGLIDLLPQFLLLAAACAIISVWFPVHRWLAALLFPWLAHSLISSSSTPALPTNTANEPYSDQPDLINMPPSGRLLTARA